MTPIPLIRVSGSHAAVGAQIGEATGEVVRAAAGEYGSAALEAARAYRDVTARELPWVLEELDAVAEAAGADPLAVLAASIEELHVERAALACTDVVAGPPLADGRLLVGHNNDLDERDEDDVVAIEWRVDGEPTIFTLGIGPWISVGWSSAGLSLTGNELTPNDERVGLPRLLQVRDALRARTLDDAVARCLHPARASSYNWVLAHRDGRALNGEGSATAAAVTERDAFVHANHYLEPEMARFEANPRLTGSCARAERAAALLGEAGPGEVDEAWLRGALSDHGGGAGSLCRHGDPDGTKTVFWCVADVTNGVVSYGRGNPCSPGAQTYRFEPRPGARPTYMSRGSRPMTAAPAFEGCTSLEETPRFWPCPGARPTAMSRRDNGRGSAV